MLASEANDPASIKAALLARAAALAPKLRERARKAEELRRCPEESVADFVDADLLRICQPARWGGFELPWDALCEVSRVLARGDGSQAWVANIYNDHTQLLGMFPLEAQADVWDKDSGTRLSAAIEPSGKARPVPGGGVMFAGRHRYSSGVDHAHWMICGGNILEDGKEPHRAFFLVPKKDATVIDDWQVMGLAGTGSKSFEVQETFIPAHRILDGDDSDDGKGPGTLINTAAVFRMPRRDIAGSGFAAIGLGIAEGFVDDYVAYTKTRVSRGVVMSETMGTQMGIGASSAELIAAARIVLGGVRDVMAVLERGERIATEQRTKTRLASAFAGQLMLTAVQRLFQAAGGRALFLDGAMQRQLRDLYAVAAHRSLAWDLSAAAYGEILLGGAK